MPENVSIKEPTKQRCSFPPPLIRFPLASPVKVLLLLKPTTYPKPYTVEIMINHCPVCKNHPIHTIHIKNDYHIGKCDSCLLFLVRNPPTKQELHDIYSFDVGYHKEFETNPELQKEKLSIAENDYDIVATHLGHQTSKRLLDIGCSTGFFLRVAQEKGWACKGVELSKDTARIASEKYNLDVFQGELAGQPFEDGEFDVITLWDVIEHLEDPLATLNDIQHILSKDGIIVFRTPNADGLFPVLSLSIANLTGQWPHATPPGHLFQFSKRSIKRLLEKSNFEIIKIIDERIPISYTFGTPSEIFRSIKWIIYSFLFVPVALVGPWLKKGDSMVVLAKRRCDSH